MAIRRTDDVAKLNRNSRRARLEIDASVALRKEKLQGTDLHASLEEKLEEQTRRLHEEREAHYQQVSERRRARQKTADNIAEQAALPGEEILPKYIRKEDTTGIVYEARRAKQLLQEKGDIKEHFIHRTVRLIKTVLDARREMKQDPWCTSERRRDAYRKIIRDCWAPLILAVEEALETGWDFFYTVSSDMKDLILMLADLVIRAAYYFWSFLRWIWDWLWDLRFKLEKYKHVLFRTGVAVILVGSAVAFIYSSSIGYEYSYYGKLLGTAKSKEEVYSTISILGNKLSASTGTNVSIDVERDIAFRQVIVGLDAELDTKDDILNTLTYMKDLQVQACAISVNGIQTVIVENKDVAGSILADIKDSYALARSGVEYTDISYNEDVSTSEVSVLLGDIWNEDTAERFLKTGTTRSVVGEEDKPFLNVKSSELSTYTETIAFGTQYIDNASLYIGETELKTEGQPGSRSVVAEIERVNGEEVGREILSTIVTKEPVDQVIYRGSKAIPERVGTGSFIYPIRTYTISSRFGTRWGRMHTGVDFAAPTGTAIYAADGGVVTYAGWKGSYGYIVIISHGGLYETYYAHCSKLLVAEGDKIYQGQNIAQVGSTGHSTGPHLHFEIRYDGTPYNPLNYL